MGTVTNYPEFHSRRRLKCLALGRRFMPYGKAQALTDLEMSIETFAPPPKVEDTNPFIRQPMTTTLSAAYEKSRQNVGRCTAHEEFMRSMRKPNVTSGYSSVVDSIRNLFRTIVSDNPGNRRDR